MTSIQHDDDLLCRANEICALQSIYDSHVLKVDREKTTNGSQILTVNLSTEFSPDLRVCFTLPPTYPSQSPPEFELSCPSMKKPQKNLLSERLQEIYWENLGQPIVYLWIEAIRDAVALWDSYPLHGEKNENFEHGVTPTVSGQLISDIVDPTLDWSLSSLPNILSGGTITDRKSTFQAHLVFPLLHKDHVSLLLAKLRTNPKIDRATHNIYAYRIVINRQSTARQNQSIMDGGQNRSIIDANESKDKLKINTDCKNHASNDKHTVNEKHSQNRSIIQTQNQSIIQDYEDDGETQAGKRLLHLLTMMQADNCMLIVSRWYGGVHLGPDRFKHINNVARSLLEANGFGSSHQKLKNGRKD